MKWIEVGIEIESEAADVVAGVLLDFGIEGFEIVDAYENARFIEEHSSSWDYVDDSLIAVEKGSCLLRFYLTDDSADVLPLLKEGLAAFGRIETRVVEDDWSEAWKRHYKPFSVGEKIVIVPVWEEYVSKEGEVVFKIDPGHVFGTGQHQSTALCVELLEKHVSRGANVLDIGCGSGILGIIGHLLGAGHITAIDIDPAAVKVCVENARLNGIGDGEFTALAGNVLADAGLCERLGVGKFDIVTANIIADVIIPMVPLVKRLLAEDGVFVVGGIIRERATDVVAALESAGFVVDEVLTQDEWVAIAAKKMPVKTG